jgi:MFS family permease
MSKMDPKARQKTKTLSVLDGSMFSVSMGLTGSFIAAYAILLGSSNLIIAMLATLPNLIAAIVQLGVHQIRPLFQSRKSYIVFFATLQAFMWLPLIFAPQLQNPGAWLLLFVTLNTVFGMLIGPVWNSLISDVVEEEERGRFFGMRNMFTGLSAFIATITAGVVLSTFKPINPLLGFALLFALAFSFRMLSAYFLSKMEEPSEEGISNEAPDIEEFVRNAPETPLGKFTIFLMLFNIAVYVASPFFPIYQLSILKMGYFTFTFLASASAISSFLTMIFWGKYVDRIGSKNVLVVSGFLIPLVPIFWALTTNLVYLTIIEIFSGIVWAGFNLSVSTYLFDATDRQNRTRQLAEYTLMVQVAIFFGAMIGSGFLGFFDKTSKTAFIIIFIVSGILRLAAMLFFYKTLKELRIIEVPIKGRIFKKFIAIKPHHGVEYEPAIESPAQAGNIARDTPKKIQEEVREYARKMSRTPRKVSAIKQLEQSEDEQDTKEYLKKLKK